MDKRKSINEIILKCVLENEDSFFLNAVPPDVEGFCRSFPTCLCFNANVQILPGSAC